MFMMLVRPSWRLDPTRTTIWSPILASFFSRSIFSPRSVMPWAFPTFLTRKAWTPQTIGWYVLLGLMLAIAARVAVVRRRRHVANRYRREALDTLATIVTDVATLELRAGALARLPALLKRVALSVVPRTEAASLTGEKWLTFLDAAYDGEGFTRGPGRLLPTLAYRSSDSFEAISDQQASDLLELTRLWIRSHDLAGRDGGGSDTGGHDLVPDVG